MKTSKYSLSGKPLDIYSGVEQLPSGHADDSITDGCLVLEGGAWRGLYTCGVLDALMLHGINFRTTVGISAGALFGLGYMSGQIGWAARLDLIYRHDPEYCGIGAFRRDHGITGFSYLYKDLMAKYPLDKKYLMNPRRRFLVGATDMQTGKITYFEKGKCRLLKAIQASATVPYISRPVVIDGRPYIDGGCAVKIPYEWAKQQGEKKIIIVKTREWDYRRKEGAPRIARTMYRNYPALVDSISESGAHFNRMCGELSERAEKKEIFVMAPGRPVTVSRFEGDMEKLGELYWLGFHEMEARMDELKEYIGTDRAGTVS